jgi:hypothetical protein
MTGRPKALISISSIIRKTVCCAALGSLLIVYGCGGDSHHSGTAEKYPEGVSEDIGEQLKYDARVDSFSSEGEDLVINVNSSWIQSPPGMRERALGQWYSLWQPSHGAASRIVVKFDGNEVESWTAQGYRPATKEGEQPSEG